MLRRFSAPPIPQIIGRTQNEPEAEDPMRCRATDISITSGMRAGAMRITPRRVASAVSKSKGSATEPT